MIKRVKKILKDLQENQAQLKTGQLELLASQQLQALAGTFYIPHTSWSMTPQTILHILNIITLKGCKNIIEFGSGATTLYIAQLLKQKRIKRNFFSVESDKEWLSILQQHINEMNLENYVTLIEAPLRNISSTYSYKNQETWYNIKDVAMAIKGIDQFDLVIIDGPFGGSTPFARYSAYPFLKSKTSTNTTWLLDDTKRSHESEIIGQWSKQSGLRSVNYNRYSLLTADITFDFCPYRLQ